MFHWQCNVASRTLDNSELRDEAQLSSLERKETAALQRALCVVELLVIAGSGWVWMGLANPSPFDW